ncbi:MAG: CHASE2 domain-containing protein, partial [candidate division Zixibacteria bacterium]|nr:CHASE2 domain-containing protein [candidate division Zixibacteria bacterium]
MFGRYSSYALCLLVALLAVVLYLNDFGPVARLERSLNDVLLRFTAHSDIRPNVAIVTIDAKAQAAYGKWPWNRDRLADLLAAVATGEPAAMAVDISLSEDASQDSAGYTKILADQLSWIDKAVLSYDFAPGTYRSPKTSNPKFLFKNSLTIPNELDESHDEYCLTARRVFLPAEKLLEAQSQLGFSYDVPDDDMVLRRHPMFLHFEGYTYPSLILRTAAVYLGVAPDQVSLTPGREIRIGSKRTIPVDHEGKYFINFSKGKPFQMWSAADILSPGFDLSRLKGKAVVVAVDDPSVTETFPTATEESVAGPVVKASVLENIINSHMLVPPQGVSIIYVVIMFAIGVMAALSMPRIPAMYRIVTALGCLMVLINVNYILLSQFATLPNTLYIGLELVLLTIISPFLDSELLTGAAPAGIERPHQMMKTAKRAVKEAPEPVMVREIKSLATDPENQATTALSSTPNSDKTKASVTGTVIDEQMLNPDSAIAQTIASGKIMQDRTPTEFTEYPPPAVQVAEPVATDDSNSGRVEHQELPGASAQNMGISDLTHLGRYQIIGSLGRGAMGTVYKGIDPAINRPVALKTIRLDFVNDPAELVELKERLYLEAQAAGKLSHPNIVTIYDVGEDASLQYIAMEYLEGQTLEALIKKQTKFNYKIIAQTIVQICNALTYAHDHGIVHRDIKPANIMILKDYTVKVMDFGIARIDSHSVTKTGIAMGTPNYISPEQLRGEAIDRRSDLFSLGVVMYEVLLGRRPFRGEN